MGFCAAVIAAPVTVPDFSFENINVGGPGGNVGGSAGALLGTAPNWDSSGNAGNGVQSVEAGDDFFGVATLPPPGDGTNYFYMNTQTAGGVTTSAYCWQDIGPLQSNTTYTLTIAVGETLQGLTGAGFIALVNGQSPFQTILASTPVDTTAYTAGTFSNVTVVYTTGAKVSGDLTILMQGNSGQQIAFDNVRLDAETAANPTALLPVTSSAFTSNSIFTGASLALPANTVYVGNPVSLSENPSGTAPFAYQWLTDNGSGGVTFTPISGATNSNLSINTASFTPGSPVEYEVKATTSGGNSTSPPVSITAIKGPPVIFVDTVPTMGADDVGGTVTFTATFVGSSPMSFQWLFDNGGGPAPISGATNETLTIANLQVTNAGSYSLVASNALGVATNDAGAFTVNSASTNAADGVVTATAFQTGLGTNTIFTPTWVLATNSLIAGASPAAETPSLAAFQYAGCGGVPVLTDGKAGSMPPAGNASSTLAAGGLAPVGNSVTYALPTNGAPYGWTITNIVTYGGWTDSGRMEQMYDIFYSTYAAPSNFGSQINPGGSSGGYAGVDYQYPDPTSIDPNGVQCATRVSLTSTNGALVQNVSGLQFFFNIQAKAPENGWEGYGEIQVFGTPSAPAIVLISNTAPAFAGDVAGSAVTFITSFSSPNPLSYEWLFDNGSGPAPVPGATNAILTITNLQTTNTGSYSCVVSNSTGSSLASSAASLAVSDYPSPDSYGVIDAQAYQADGVPFFYPTWTLPPGSLIAGLLPVVVGPGNFAAETATGVAVLTDGSIGGIGSGNDVDMITGGPNAGTWLIYALPSANAEAGYTITNIQVFGGWSDHGRDEQSYTIYSSTPAAPYVFTNAASQTPNVMVYWDYLPPNVGAVANMSRMTYTAASGGPLASNVANILINFNSAENQYEGYSQIAVYGFPTPGQVTVPPVVVTDITPYVGSDVAGSSATFTAAFTSTEALSYQWYVITNVVTGGVTNAVTSAVSGGTARSLTIANLQAADTGSYFVVASNALGTVSSTTNSFTVNRAPTPVSGITEAFAYQQTFSGGPMLYPTWTLGSGDLIKGLAPASDTGDFQNGPFAPVGGLTDGLIGFVGAGGDLTSFCSCGTSPNGSVVTYTLPASANGYNINQIVTYGGWQDSGRDWQNYTVSYATAAAPATFTTLTSVVDNPSAPALPNMTRVTIAGASGAPLATGVGAVTFNFSTPAGQENGWQGYSELAVYGQPTPAPLTFSSLSVSSGSLILAGSGGTAGSNYVLLSTTNLALPQSEWITNTTGVFNGSGGFSNAIPINRSMPAQFFQLKTP